MAFSRITYTYSGQTSFAVNFTLGYLDQRHVTARVNDEVDGSNEPVYRTITWITEGTVSISGSLTTGDTIVFERTTPKDALQHDYQDGAVIEEENLDESMKQAIMLVHEVLDGRFATLQADLDMGSNNIVNVADPVNAQDVATKNYIDTFEAINTAAAIAARNLAEQWASEDEDVVVSGGEYSAKHYSLKSAASAASASADAATIQTALQGTLWSGGVRALTNADSPYTIQSSDSGVFFNVDTSGGNVQINLPSIATVGEPFTVGVAKSTSDTNTVELVRNGSDTIDSAAASTFISNGGEARAVSADNGPSPDNWVTAIFGQSRGDFVIDNLIEGTDFTAGTDNTITLSSAPGSENNVDIYFDGVYQEGTEYSVSGTTVTFTSTIPSGVTSIEAKIGASVEISVPADNSVDRDKINFSEVRPTSTQLQNASNVERLTNPADVKDIVQNMSGQPVLLQTVSASGDATITLDEISSTYDEYLVRFENILPSADDVNFRVQFTVGGVVQSGSSDYAWRRINNTATATNSTSGNITLNGNGSNSGVGNVVAKGGASGEIALRNANSTTIETNIEVTNGHYAQASDDLNASLNGSNGQLLDETQQVDGIVFSFNTGNIASGTFKLYGVV